jgi:hypothetical protein
LGNAAKYISYAYQLLSERDRFLLSSYHTISRVSVCGSRVSFLVALHKYSCAYGSELNRLPAKLLRRFPETDNVKNVELFIHVYGLFKL